MGTLLPEALFGVARLLGVRGNYTPNCTDSGLAQKRRSPRQRVTVQASEGCSFRQLLGPLAEPESKQFELCCFKSLSIRANFQPLQPYNICFNYLRIACRAIIRVATMPANSLNGVYRYYIDCIERVSTKAAASPL